MRIVAVYVLTFVGNSAFLTFALVVFVEIEGGNLFGVFAGNKALDVFRRNSLVGEIFLVGRIFNGVHTYNGSTVVDFIPTGVVLRAVFPFLRFVGLVGEVENLAGGY